MLFYLLLAFIFSLFGFLSNFYILQLNLKITIWNLFHRPDILKTSINLSQLLFKHKDINQTF